MSSARLTVLPLCTTHCQHSLVPFPQVPDKSGTPSKFIQPCARFPTWKGDLLHCLWFPDHSSLLCACWVCWTLLLPKLDPSEWKEWGMYFKQHCSHLPKEEVLLYNWKGRFQTPFEWTQLSKSILRSIYCSSHLWIRKKTVWESWKYLLQEVKFPYSPVGDKLGFNYWLMILEFDCVIL